MQCSDEGEIPQRAVGELRRVERAIHTGRSEREAKTCLLAPNHQVRTLKRLGYRVFKCRVVAVLDDRLKRGGKIMTIMCERWSTRADLNRAERAVLIRTELVVEAPPAQTLAHGGKHWIPMWLDKLSHDGFTNIEAGSVGLWPSFLVAEHHG